MTLTLSLSPARMTDATFDTALDATFDAPFNAPFDERPFVNDLMHHMAALRRYAVRLAASAADAEDLVQETLLKCWGARTRYVAGTNFLAWARTIMRNAFFTSIRRRRFEIDAPDDVLPHARVAPAQDVAIELRQTLAALEHLGEGQQRAVVMASEGVSIEDGAATLGIPLNTYKSWVRRGRARLGALLDEPVREDIPAAAARHDGKPRSGSRRDWSGVVIG